jgi:hypothetical protein
VGTRTRRTECLFNLPDFSGAVKPKIKISARCAHFCAARQLFFEKKRDFLFTETSFCCIINTDKTLPDPVQAEEC